MQFSVKKDGGIATIILNRPAALNSLNQDLLDGLLAALHEVAEDRTVRVVVITGNGRAFCAGGDLFFLVSLTNPVSARNFIEQGGLIPTTIMNMAKPVIAMVNGVAAGAGFNIALACRSGSLRKVCTFWAELHQGRSCARLRRTVLIAAHRWTV